MEEKLFPSGITEKQFMREFERGKSFVDNGITDYFILLDNKSFENVKEIGNTTVKEIVDLFGASYLMLFRFAIKIKCDGVVDPREEYQTLKIRPVLKSDSKKIRGVYRFIPNSAFMCEWRDGSGCELLLPFVQNDGAKVQFLREYPQYLVKKEYAVKHDEKTSNAPYFYAKHIIETLPDYFDCVFAIATYKHTNIIVPMPKESAKKTFKNRDVDSSGVKRRLIHEVRQHDRKNLKDEPFVKEHLRGTSNLTINGIDVTIMASWEWSKKYANKQGGLT